jgi:3-hydroxyacyl-CoA dehydrogenase/enoyl-CoA hydratase/3-hydroxybutyryl-CoA epimerase
MSHSVDLNTDLLRLEVDASGVATVWIDDPGASVNKINRATLDGFSEVLGRLEQMDDLLGVVFISGKEASFIVGADLEMLDSFDSPAEVRGVSRRAHRLLWRVQNLSVPTVAAIEGPCMGGGLEMILGCDYRLASTHDDTKLALPEVKLGLIPGGGGTQYLPRLLGVQQALTLMLTGKNTYPKKARSTGLVDALIHPPGLYEAGKRAVRQLANGNITVDRDAQSLGERLLEGTTVSRRLIYQQAERRAQQRTGDNYPAPSRLVDAVRTGMESGIDEGLDTEMRHFSELVFTSESEALVQLFFARQEATTPPVEDAPDAIARVGILGAGLMGGGIAEVTATSGLEVVLKDKNLDLAARGKKQVWSAMEKKRTKGIVNQFERDQTAERVVPTASYARMTHCNVVVEAVPEDLELKHEVLSEVEAVVSEDAILATNTSAIPIGRIAEGIAHPERLIGMHYFSPVADVPLVELIPSEQTSDATLATAFDLARQQDKIPIVVEDGPGFYTTRILTLYLNEALLLLEEGADIVTVDEMMEDHGFPMGPFELLDFVGMDVAGKIHEVMNDHLPLEPKDVSDSTRRLASVNLLGQKTNVGFYHYGPAEDGPGKTRKDVNEDIYRSLGQTTRTTPPADVVQDRLTLMMVNEAIRCLDEGVLQGPADGDLGAVLGLGFPPYLGGPFHYVDQEGPDRIARRLRDLAYRFGSRFAPAELLVEQEEHDAPFHKSHDPA